MPQSHDPLPQNPSPDPALPPSADFPHAHPVPATPARTPLLIWAILGGVGFLALLFVAGVIGLLVLLLSKSQPLPSRPAPRLTSAPIVAPAPKPSVATASSPSADLSAEELFSRAAPAVVRIEILDAQDQPLGQGSGFIIDSPGLVVTNHHVIRGAFGAQVLLHDKRKLKVLGVVALNQQRDLAILQVEDGDYPALTMAIEDLPRVGATVYAIGSPKGLTNTLSQGLVSALRSEDGSQKPDIVQTTAAISPGSSGGPLLDARGQVVGITTAYLSGGQNLNFAVPIWTVAELLQHKTAAQSLAKTCGKPYQKELDNLLHTVNIFLDQYDPSRAQAYLAQGKRDFGHEWLYRKAMARAFLLEHNHSAAIDLIKELLEEKPADEEVVCMLADCYRKMKEFETAEQILRNQLGKNLDSQRIKLEMGLTRTRHAMHLFEKGLRSQAEDQLRRALDCDPGNLAILTEVAECHRKMGDIAKAKVIQSMIDRQVAQGFNDYKKKKPGTPSASIFPPPPSPPPLTMGGTGTTPVALLGARMLINSRTGEKWCSISIMNQGSQPVYVGKITVNDKYTIPVFQTLAPQGMWFGRVEMKESAHKFSIATDQGTRLVEMPKTQDTPPSPQDLSPPAQSP